MNDFYMAGGTALALQIGHRQSMDFDFFTQNPLNNDDIILKCRRIGHFELFELEQNTVHGTLDHVAISFLTYEYPLLCRLHSHNRLQLADVYDLALMKLAAISSRGAKKDFVDLYFILQHFSLRDLFTAYERKYGKELGNRYHLLKSLVYFDDAEEEPMPVMCEPVEWEDVKGFLVGRVKGIPLV